MKHHLMLDDAPYSRSSTSDRNTARAHLKIGSFEASAHVDVTPAGLIAIGGLVATILISVVPIVLAAQKARRD